MKVSGINENVYLSKSGLHKFDVHTDGEFDAAKNNQYAAQTQNSISFKSGSDISKRMWLQFRKLSNYMKEPSEMTNALIAMIGTGGIAPFAIMCSPNHKKDARHPDEKVEKDKKFFQAIRQPVSAFLAFAFQVPTTIGIAMGLNHLAYKKHVKLFDDEVLGHLIPSKKYLKSQAKNALSDSAKPELKTEWSEELKIATDEEKITKGLKQQLKQDYQEVGIDISDEELTKKAQNKNKRRKYIAEQMADAKYDNLINKKVEELSNKNFNIKDTDLVTEKYQKLAKNNYKEEFASLKKNANLNWFDKLINSIGISNKKLSKLSNAEKALAKEKGLALMKQEEPSVFENAQAKLRKFVENKNVQAQKFYSNKIFWLTLVTNLFMVAFSCVALNWLHPKFADFIDTIKGKRDAHKPSQEKKVEVKA